MNITKNYQTIERCLQRHEFVEILVRLAIAKFKDTQMCSSIAEAVTKLLNDNILPYSQKADDETFREEHLYSWEVNDILDRNE